MATITGQEFADYELIISDDHSSDETAAFLRGLDHPNVRVVSPDGAPSMTEHWEWVLSQARGDWVMFVGQDDGVQTYFFKLAGELTAIADRKGIRAITSERAYFFWRGCEAFYGDAAVGFSATGSARVLDSGWQSFLVLTGMQSYFELPQMYTTSLFRRDLIDEARRKQSGKLFVTHPQDANLAAIACSLERKFLKSMIPLGWVGSSPKSAGLAVAAALTDEHGGFDSLRKDYLGRISNSQLTYHPLAGDFSLSSNAVYFWAALLCTDGLRRGWINRLLGSAVLKMLIFGSARAEIDSAGNVFGTGRLIMLKELTARNNSSDFMVKLIAALHPLACRVMRTLGCGCRRVRRLFRPERAVRLEISWREEPDIDLTKAAARTKEFVSAAGLIETLSADMQ